VALKLRRGETLRGGDLATVHRWIGDLLEYSVGCIETPVLSRMIASWTAQDFTLVVQWNALFLASRETSELRAETLQMGYSLRKLLTGRE
jgi:urease accessory protein